MTPIIIQINSRTRVIKLVYTPNALGIDKPHYFLKEIIEIWKNSSKTEDIAADARNIAHNYLNQIGFENISLVE